MTRRLATSRLFAALAAGLAFAATLAVLLLARSTDGRAGAQIPVTADDHTVRASKLLQRVRVTGDKRLYDRAAAELERALALRPGDPGALTERASLKLSRHDFRGALADARAARRGAPEANKPFGALVDALVELGRYRAAGRALQAMVDRKPTLDAYTRVSYFRELHGDLDGAAEALHLAISAGGAIPENTAFAFALLGDLELLRGRPRAAERAFRAALGLVPRHTPSRFGLARVDIARRDRRSALRRIKQLVPASGEPAYTIVLGELELELGRRAAAARHFALARREILRHGSTGENVAAELALFEADHGSPARAVRLGREGWRHAPSVGSADALGWALTRAGRPHEGLRWAQRALRLGSREPAFLRHARIARRLAGAQPCAPADC